MNFPLKVAIKGKGVETLNKQSYLAAGGEGTVCQKGGLAYKIYHDPKRMIPVSKIQELQQLEGIPNVLGPRDILLDPKSNTPIGFTMPFMKKTEYLCRLFNKNFKQDNNISPDMVVEMVKIMQETLAKIHQHKILVVDINEMNFLTSLLWDQVFFIDVDSYQTPGHKATALMETVRDRTTPKGQFTEMSDWFSFAIVSFQLYMGYHPYKKGRHPQFKPKDWSARMDQNISIFHKDIDLADNWKTWDLIPKPHLEWYQRVFRDKERSIPPLPDGVTVIGVLQPVVVTGTDKFEVTLVKDFKDKLLGTYFFNGFQHGITEKHLYSNHNVLKTFTSKIKKVSLAQVIGATPVVVFHDGNEVRFENVDGTNIGTIAASQAMQYNGCIYTVYNGKMTENTFKSFPNKTAHLTKQVGNVFEPATKLFPGVAVQDILGKCWMAIPYSPGKLSNLNIPELDGQRIIDAKFENNVCIVVSEKDGQYNRTVLCFDAQVTHYTCRIDEDVDFTGVNFTTLKNGVCIHIPADDRVEVFKDNSTVKVVNDPPFSTDMKLVNDSTGVMFINRNKLYSVSLK